MTDRNPRFLAYCLAHGFDDPGAMVEHEREAWPGGLMAGFVIWMSKRWREWDVGQRGRTIGPAHSQYPVCRSDAEHAAFDWWLLFSARAFRDADWDAAERLEKVAPFGAFGEAAFQ